MDNTRIIILYDYYEKLLTDQQKDYFEDYYFSNLSLSEIAENKGVSRNAVHNMLKGTTEKLEGLENKLKIFEKNKKVEELIKDEDLKKQIMDILEGE